MKLSKLKEWCLSRYHAIRFFLQSLQIKYKLSIIIALIVIIVITIFSLPVLIHQERILEEKVQEAGRLSAELLSDNVRDILLCKITGACKADGTVREQLARLIQTRIKDLRYAFVIDTDHDFRILPDTLAEAVHRDSLYYQRLLAQEKLLPQYRDDIIEYYHPVKVRVDGSGRQRTLGVVGVGFSTQAIYAPIKRTKSLIFSSAAFVILFSVLGIYFLAKLLVTRITALSNAAREVGMGNLQVKVISEGNDELGHLAREFNGMVTHLREKLHMQKFISKLTVQMIREQGGSRLRLAEGERHHVAILFSDIRNFTGIAELLEPEQIVRLINVYFNLQTEAIESNGGIVDKFMGDQIMAIFPTKRMLVNAISAAVAIQRGIRELNQARARAGEATLGVGIGINHGPAVLGNMGSKDRMDYTVIGDVVNIAARLCSIAKAGQIIAALGDGQPLNGKYPTSKLQPIIVKGRTRPVEICEIDYDHDLVM